ncbi:MAG: hypothetical protein MJ239_04145 [Bacilli bacterium]|nr:hypothetical protein [Bacilli bacterium]
MTSKKTITILTLAAPFLFACGGQGCPVESSLPAVTYNLTFHQTEQGPVEDKVVKVTVGKTRIEQVWGQEPEINEKDGYESEWESYTIDDKTSDFSVEPVYKPIEYIATFINRVNGEILGSQPYTMETKELTLPELPTDFGYTYEWESYVITAGGMNVYCDRTANIHTARFFQDEEKTIQVGEDVKFSIESESIPEPEVPAVQGYDGFWSEYSLKLDQDIDIIARYELHAFYVQFVAEGENVGEPVPYNVEQAYADIEKPAVPEKTGYTGNWPSEVTLQYKDKTDPQIIDADYVANNYTITYVGADGSELGTSTVTYDAEYTLRSEEDGYTWYLEDEKISKTGVWNIAKDVTLTSKSKYLYVDFEDGENADILVAKIGTTQSNIKIADDALLGKCLKVTLTSNYTMLDVKSGVFDSMFKDPAVMEVWFDAKGDWQSNDFRYMHNGGKVTYEQNLNEYGLSDGWKTFAFTRAMYENYKTGTNEAFIYAAGATSGLSIYFDNIRVSYKALDSYGFENGRLVSQTTSGYEKIASYRAFNSTSELFVANGASITSYGFDYENKTEGNRSLRITKANNYIAFFYKGFLSAVDDNHVMKFDLYSTIGANATVGNFVDGNNSRETYGISSHPADKWCTYTVTKNMMDGNGRFLIVQGSTGGDWFFDNFRLVEVE